MRRSQDQESIGDRLLRKPLDVVGEMHLQEREVCALLDRIAAAEWADEEDLARVLRFLRMDLPLHLQDEEEDLFPLLRRRCDPEEEIDKVIARLECNHQESLLAAAGAIAILEQAQAASIPLGESDREQLTAFAAHARRHLIVENAIILPIARGNLTLDDLTTLGLRMRQRRGLDRPS